MLLYLETSHAELTVWTRRRAFIDQDRIEKIFEET